MWRVCLFGILCLFSASLLIVKSAERFCVLRTLRGERTSREYCKLVVVVVVVVDLRQAEETTTVSHVVQTVLGVAVVCRLLPLHHVYGLRQVRQRRKTQRGFPHVR